MALPLYGAFDQSAKSRQVSAAYQHRAEKSLDQSGVWVTDSRRTLIRQHRDVRPPRTSRDRLPPAPYQASTDTDRQTHTLIALSELHRIARQNNMPTLPPADSSLMEAYWQCSH